MQEITKKTALVLDDSATARSTARIQLSNMGITNVTAVERIPDAIRQVKTKTFDIILCDYHLWDDRDGQQFLEEVRTSRLVSHTNVFIMVTGEREYEKVMTVAEYAPDDYVLKPYTADLLEKRIVDAARKKHDLAGILLPLDKENYKEALEACERRLGSPASAYRLYVMRIQAETLAILEEYEKSARAFEEILKKTSAPWAELWLAKALLKLGEIARATSIFERIAKDNPTYMANHDSLAEYHESVGDLHSAQAEIMKAVEKSPHRIDRQNRLGNIALLNNDVATAEKAYSEVVKRWSWSCHNNPEAYLRLAEIAIAKGDVKSAENTISRLGKSFKQNPSAEFCLAIAGVDMERKKGNANGAGQHFAAALSIAKSPEGQQSLPEHSVLRFAVECFSFGQKALGECLILEKCSSGVRGKALRETVLRYASDEATKNHIRSLFAEEESATETEPVVGEESAPITEEPVRVVEEPAPIIEEPAPTVTDEDVTDVRDSCFELSRQGDWEWAIRLSMEEAKKYPNNPEAQFVVAQMLLAQMEKHGWNEDSIWTVKKYLDAAKRLAPWHKRFGMMKMMTDRVMKKYGIDTKEGAPPAKSDD